MHYVNYDHVFIYYDPILLVTILTMFKAVL